MHATGARKPGVKLNLRNFKLPVDRVVLLDLESKNDYHGQLAQFMMQQFMSVNANLEDILCHRSRKKCKNQCTAQLRSRVDPPTMIIVRSLCAATRQGLVQFSIGQIIWPAESKDLGFEHEDRSQKYEKTIDNEDEANETKLLLELQLVNVNDPCWIGQLPRQDTADSMTDCQPCDGESQSVHREEDVAIGMPFVYPLQVWTPPQQ